MISNDVVNRLNFPAYPRAFIASARIHRERGRVFVAMPFDAPHSKALWKLLQRLCKDHGLDVRRADNALYPRPVVVDILEELERAEIIIADLTRQNPNVLYELGIAHTRCDSVILLAKRGQSLPFNLASLRCLFFNLNSTEGRNQLSQNLRRMLESIRQPHNPTVLKDKLARTQSVIADLKMLNDLPDEELRDETVWISGFLTSFAIGEREPFDAKDNAYRAALLEEKDCLLRLARRGCSMRCIITPPDKGNLFAATLPHTLPRLKTLIALLESDDPSLANIEWVISPFRQKNFYIIGSICFSEGFKADLERGYPFTLRLTDPQAISSSTALHGLLFERLRNLTLKTYLPAKVRSRNHKASRSRGAGESQHSCSYGEAIERSRGRRCRRRHQPRGKGRRFACRW
jgi:hypothetical protein